MSVKVDPAPGARKWRTLAYVLIFLIVVKVAALLLAGPGALELDSLEYWNLSSQVLGGDVWMLEHPIAYRTPIYPWLLALIRLVAGTSAMAAVVCAQGCLLVATVWMAGSLAVTISRRESARVWTLVASLLAVSSITYGRAVLTEVLFAFLLMLHLVCQAAHAQRGSWAGGIASAGSLALCILTRPIAMLLWIADLALLLMLKRARIGQLMVMGLVLLAMLAPWVLRNQHLFGKPALTEFMGRNLWIVTFQGQAGAGLDLPSGPATREFRLRIASLLNSDQWRLTWSVSNALVQSGLNDAEADRAMLAVCRQAIAERPAHFAERAVRRIGNFWRCVPSHLPQSTDDPQLLAGQRGWHFPTAKAEWLEKSRLSRWVWVNSIVAVTTVLSLVVLVWCAETRAWGLWCGLVLLYFSTITGLLEIPNYRYRMVVEPLMATVVGAACALCSTKPAASCVESVEETRATS